MQLLRIALASILVSTAAFANKVGDDESKVAYQNTGSGNHTVQIANTSPGGTNPEELVAVVYNADGKMVGWIVIEAGGSNPVTAPEGGRIEVDDRKYSGTQTDPKVEKDTNTSGGTFTVS